jgi:hypothetical protein
MDIALAVYYIYNDPPADYGNAATYAALCATWRDGRDVPTEGELDTAWAAVLAEQSSQAAIDAANEAMWDTICDETEFTALTLTQKFEHLQAVLTHIRYLRGEYEYE